MTDRTFRIEVTIDPAKAVAGARRVESELDKLDGAGQNLGKTLGNAFKLIGTSLVVREIAQLTTAYTNAQNRLRTVIDSEAELAAVTEELFRISNKTLASFEASAETYARVALATKDLGLTQNDVLQFTESLNQAISLSGASAQEAQAGLIQLSQGLASGALRGDEMRAVLEQLPVVADVIADSLGITRGELRQLGAEGKVTAEVVVGAFREARLELEERFANAVPTLSQAFVVLQNNLLQFVGETDKALGASAGFSQGIIFLADNLELVAGAALVVGAAYAATYVPATLSAGVATNFLVKNLLAAGAFLKSNPFALAVGGLTAAGLAADFFADEMESLAEQTDKAVSQFDRFALTEFGKVGAEVLSLQEKIEHLENLQSTGVNTSELVNKKLAEYREQLTKAQQALDFMRNAEASTTVQAQAHLEAREKLRESLALVVASIEQENTLLQLGSRERQIQAQLLQEIAKLEKDGVKLSDDQKAVLEGTLRLNQVLQDRASVLERIRGPQEKFAADLEQLKILQQTNAITAEEFTAELARMAASADGVDLSALGVDKLGVDVAGFDLAKFQQMLALARGGEVFGPEAPEEEQFAPPTTGELSEELQLQAALYERIKGPAQEYAESQIQLQQLLDDGRISAEEYDATLKDLAITLGQPLPTSQLTDAQQALQTLSEAGTEALTGLGDAILDFAYVGQQSFEEFTSSLLLNLSRIFAEKALIALIDAFSGGGFSASGLSGLLFGGQRAEGGDVGPGKSYLVGERGPELFTPPHAGEIIPAGETAARMQAAANPQVNVSAPPAQVAIYNVTDPNEIPRGMQSAAGEQAIMNVIQKNKHTIRGSLSS
jgi:tape measure domain-containing protein